MTRSGQVEAKRSDQEEEGEVAEWAGHLKEDEDQQQHVEYNEAEHQAPQSWVWPHEGAVRHVDDANENKHNHHGNEPPFRVVYGIVGSILQDSHVDQHHGDEHQRQDCVSTPKHRKYSNMTPQITQDSSCVV